MIIFAVNPYKSLRNVSFFYHFGAKIRQNCLLLYDFLSFFVQPIEKIIYFALKT